jgi:hypothetical protein
MKPDYNIENIKTNVKKIPSVKYLNVLVYIFMGLSIVVLGKQNYNLTHQNQQDNSEKAVEIKTTERSVKPKSVKQTVETCPDGYMSAGAGYCKNIVCVSYRLYDRNFYIWYGSKEIQQIDKDLKSKGYTCNGSPFGYLAYGINMIPARSETIDVPITSEVPMD